MKSFNADGGTSTFGGIEDQKNFRFHRVCQLIGVTN